jgi:FkbM family methyltransferase
MRLVRAVGRRLRRLILPLIGFWDLVRRLEELHAQVAAEAESAKRRHDLAMEWHGASLARLDDLTGRMGARNSPLAALVGVEIDRLDGYLVHHAAVLRDSVEALRAEVGTVAHGLGTLRAEVGTVAHGLGTLRAEVGTVARGLGTLRAEVGSSVEALRTGQRPALAYAAPGLDAVVITGDFDLVVPAAEEGLLVYVLRHGLDGLEPGVRAVLRRRLKPGGVAVDAGANIGVHSLAMAAAVGPEGRVLCFEPLHHLASALERSLRLNGFAGRARVERSALADLPGEATFHRAAHGPMSSLYPLPPEAAGNDVRVPVTTLDAVVPPGSRVDLVKMDVEGAEPRLWRGMQRVVADNPGIEVVLEWSASHFRRSGEDPDAFMAAIRAAGFHAFAVEDDGPPGRLAPVGEPAALEAANLLLTRRGTTPEEAGAA